MSRLGFGAFLAPHHPIGENPMLQFRRDIKFVAKKLGMDAAALQALIDSPPQSHSNYPNHMALHGKLTAIKTALRRLA